MSHHDTHDSDCAETHDGHADDHVHGADCGHETIAHEGHTDYVVAGRLHHPHGDHCDDHGAAEAA